MPTYHYMCDECGFEESRVQEIGSTRHHECPECNKGTCNRVLKPIKEMTPATVTPGASVQKQFEYRRCDEQLTEIRRKNKLPPNTNGDQLAADRHMGRKNKIVKE